MGVVQIFGEQESPDPKIPLPPNTGENDNQTGNVFDILPNSRVAHGIPARVIYQQLEALLISHGVDLKDPKFCSDFKIITYLIEGAINRTDGVSSDRCLLLDTLRMIMNDTNPGDSQGLFGDLVGRV